jgi:hypothetical protein
MMGTESINEPQHSRTTMLTPGSPNEPLPLPEAPPAIEGLNPAEAAAGTVEQLLVVHGANFTDACVITFDGAPQLTNYEAANKLNTSLVLATVAAGDYPVTVKLGPLETEPAAIFRVVEPEAEAHEVDPDELEDEIEQAEDEGEFRPVHRAAKPVAKKPTKTRR